MKRSAQGALALCAAAIAVCVCGVAAQQDNSESRKNAHPIAAAMLPPILFTAAPVYDSLAALHGGERFPRGAQLMILRDGQMQPLTPGLAASADPSIAFDGKAVLFAGKKQAGDPWQIWMQGTDGGDPQRVMAAATDLIRPLWMPGGRMVYARRTPAGFALETAELDGSGAQRLSFLPGNFVPDDVLRDGRVLFESGFPLGAGATPEIFLVYADGSGVESVRCDHPDAPEGREHGRQMLSGDIVFTHEPGLARFTSALAEEAEVSAPKGDYAGDVAELPDGRWVLSVRNPDAQHAALRAWKPGAPAVQVIAADAQRDLVQPVVVAPRAIPKRHPSGLHDWTTGNLLALNARLTRSGPLATAPAQVEAETMDRSGHAVKLGAAPVESDGSFFVQTKGDEPLRFILLDAQGRTIREERGWFWVRSGEQRICVGCHTGPERAPDNRVPAVLLRTTTPVDLSGSAKTMAGTNSGTAAGGH
jgi:hypothetical protein